jgi:mannose-1-phosphate guanylyltransferase
MKYVIICGGVGAKLWPESSPTMPKHFLPLVSGKSLFQINWEDLRKKIDAADIFLQTNPIQAELALKQEPEISKDNILLEPEPRNTGPAIGLTAALLTKKGFGDEPFILIQADDLRKPVERLYDMAQVLEKYALNSDKYITGCIKPDRIVRGVDYLVKGKLLDNQNGINVYEVADYIDRSEEEKLQKYMGTDDLMIHCNHTTMTPNNYLKIYEKYRKDWYEPLMEIVNGGPVDENFLKMAKGAQEEVTPLLHRSGQGIMVELPFDWVDLGTWESVDKYLEDNNLLNKDKQIEIEGQNNFVRSDKTVAIVGLSDLVVIDSPNGLLICPKSMSGKLGQVPEKLKQN